MKNIVNFTVMYYLHENNLIFTTQHFLILHFVSKISRNRIRDFNFQNFEEISTTHPKNDSYYEDNKIADLDPMERKTILENW